MGEPVYEGEIPDDGIVSRLSEIEGYRTTGVLRFQDGETTGEVALVQGQISADQPERDDGSDAVEELLELRTGTFALIQRLPPLPVSKGDDSFREGSLEVHVPADLMNYCERAGLTGLLILEFKKDKAEIVYDKGELSGIRLDGLDDLHQVFGWEEGNFRIETKGEAPDLEAELSEPPAEAEDAADPKDPSEPAPPPRPDTTGKQFLKVVEVTLAEIVKEREERRPATRTSPALPPMSGPKKHPTLRPPSASAPRKERRDQTVRVIYLGAKKLPKKPPDNGKTRHVRTDNTGEVMLTDENPARRAPSDENKELPVAVWVGVTLLVVVAALVFLANLPPLD